MAFPQVKKSLWGGHLWNPSYYIGTVGNMSKDVVLKYIQNQKQEEQPGGYMPYIHPLKRVGLRHEFQGLSSFQFRALFGLFCRQSSKFLSQYTRYSSKNLLDWQQKRSKNRHKTKMRTRPRYPAHCSFLACLAPKIRADFPSSRGAVDRRVFVE